MHRGHIEALHGVQSTALRLTGSLTVRALLVFLALLAPCSLTVGSVAAQARDFECAPGGDLSLVASRQLLTDVQAAYAQVELLQASFRQESYVAALDEGEQSSGEVWFGRPGRMRWEYRAPRAQSVVIDSRTLWLYQPDKNQVLVDDIGQVLLSNLPVLFLSGVGDLSKDFELSGACRTPAGLLLRLLPQKGGAGKGGDAPPSDALEGFDLLVDSQQKIPRGAKVSSLGGNITAILLEDVRTKGVKVTNETFVLKYPKGVDILDRRGGEPR